MQKGHLINATFSNNYLEGYFETITSKTFGIWFCDYNRIIGRLYDDFRYNISNNASDINDKTLVGQSGNSGKATGKVRIMNNANDMFENGDILVCVMTTPEYISIMQKASAIVTDLGGILSHAAIIARELKKPCVVGTGNATTILKDGMKVEVDADKGTVRIIEKTGNKILEKFLDKIDHNPITKQEGNFSIMLYGGLFPGASKKYMSRHYDIDFGAFVFFSSGVHGTLFFDMQRYLETTRSGFHKFMDGKFSDIEDFHRLWKIIDQIYGQMKGFHKLTEEKIIETIKRLYSILCQLMVATVFSEALDKNLVKEFFDYLKLNLDYEEFYDKSTLTSFESFEMKFDKILSQYKKEDATKFMWIGTDYFKGIPLASANDILSRKIIEKGGQNSIRKSYEDIQKKVIANKKIVNVYRKTLDTRSQRLFDYIQTAYYIRDVRKEPLQKILTIITQLINEFVTRNNKPISVAPYVSVYDFEERYKDPNYFTEIEQRVKGFMLYGEDGYYKFEYESLDSLKEEFFKEMEKEISHNSDGIKGVIGSRGFAKGQVKIILSEKDFHKFESGDIIVADMTRPEYVSLMKKASGIITDEGSITCHAAIISRELGLPCIIGTRNATRILKDGDVVELDANNGVVKVLSDKKASSSEINYSEWEFEFQQRDEHPIIMADYWCRSAAMNFSKELGIKDMSFDYIYTSLSKGYCKKHQKQSIIGYLQNCSLDGLEMIAEKTRKRVMALEKFHIRLSKTDIKNQNRAAFTGLWKEFDEMFRELIPWYFFPYYVTGENMLVDRLKNTLKNYKRKIEDVTDFNNAVNILIFPTKKMEFQKERDAFYDLIKSNTNETMMRNYLKDFGWMSTFLILPREKLSYEKLLSKIKETDKKDFTEEYSIQEESKKNNNLIEAKLLRIIKDDKKLMRTIKLSKEFGYLLTWSVERSLMIFSEMQEFFEETSSRLGIKKDDYIHLTYEEIISGLSKNRPYDIEERKKGYVYIMENGKAKLITGSEASIIARDIDTKLSAIDENIRELNGQSAYPGIIKGKARIIPFAKDSSQLQEGEILVCPMTSPEYLPAMKKSGAIITDEGGLLSHAAIISREFHKPCIVGTKIATRLIKNGDILEVDANKGVVRIIK